MNFLDSLQAGDWVRFYVGQETGRLYRGQIAFVKPNHEFDIVPSEPLPEGKQMITIVAKESRAGAIVKFSVKLEDNTLIESHDNMWNQVKDHCHVLPPHNTIPWKEYTLGSEFGPFVSVNFHTGIFIINGQRIHPADENGVPVTNLKGKHEFKANVTWSILENLEYFPVVGRRNLRGWDLNKTFPFCGWKKKLPNGKTIQKIAYLTDTGEIILT